MATLFRKPDEKKSLWQRIKDIALTDVGVLVRGLDSDAIERLEETLLAADFGVPATLRLVDTIERLAKQGVLRTEPEFRAAVEQEIVRLFEPRSGQRELAFSQDGEPTVYLMVGVNGVGKTTTIGKLAHRLRASGRSVLLAAGDTFRAGAVEQLEVWARRTESEFVGARAGADPASVAFDALDAACSRRADVVIVDTAGRLHTQDDLMAELAKVQRVIARKLEGAPHETLLVLDATVGQNAIAQVRTFSSALALTGLVLAKLDSTAKGGIAVAVESEFGVPVKLVGTGEAADRLDAFDPHAFARAILS